MMIITATNGDQFIEVDMPNWWNIFDWWWYLTKTIKVLITEWNGNKRICRVVKIGQSAPMTDQYPDGKL